MTTITDRPELERPRIQREIKTQSVTPAKAGVSCEGVIRLETSDGLSMPRMLKDRPGDDPTCRSFAGVTGMNAGTTG